MESKEATLDGKINDASSPSPSPSPSTLKSSAGASPSGAGAFTYNRHAYSHAQTPPPRHAGTKRSLEDVESKTDTAETQNPDEKKDTCSAALQDCPNSADPTISNLAEKISDTSFQSLTQPINLSKITGTSGEEDRPNDRHAYSRALQGDRISAAASNKKAGSIMSSSNSKWEIMFARLEAFNEKHGHCLVPNRYTGDPALGSWVSTQRRQYKILSSGSSESTPMTPARAHRLEAIDFAWATRDPRHVPWESRFNQLVEYKKKHGDCLVPIGYKGNSQLANWVSTQRQEYKIKNDGKPSRLTPERIQRLNEIGFVWEAQRGGSRAKNKKPRLVDDAMLRSSFQHGPRMVSDNSIDIGTGSPDQTALQRPRSAIRSQSHSPYTPHPTPTDKLLLQRNQSVPYVAAHHQKEFHRNLTNGYDSKNFATHQSYLQFCNSQVLPTQSFDSQHASTFPTGHAATFMTGQLPNSNTKGGHVNFAEPHPGSNLKQPPERKVTSDDDVFADAEEDTEMSSMADAYFESKRADVVSHSNGQTFAQPEALTVKKQQPFQLAKAKTVTRAVSADLESGPFAPKTKRDENDAAMALLSWTPRG